MDETPLVVTLRHITAADLSDAHGHTPRSEDELRVVLADHLCAAGWEVAERVLCAAGEADLVVRSAHSLAIIETKFRLDRRSILTACTQLLLYQQAIDPGAQLIIAGYATPETANRIPQAEGLGIALIAWERSPQHANASRAHNSGLSTLTPHLPVPELQWDVQTLAQAQGLATVAQLSRATGIARQSLYSIWRGEADNVSLVLLGRLARGLGTNPGEWFRWEDKQLAWQIHLLAVARLNITTANQFGFAASLYQRQATWFWDGTAQFVFRTSLARLATVFLHAGQPFDVGELFRWNAEGSSEG